MTRLAALLCLLASTLAAQDRGEWELILHIMQPGQEPVVRLYGVMVSEPACHLAGQGLAMLVMASDPTAAVGVTCRRRISA